MIDGIEVFFGSSHSSFLEFMFLRQAVMTVSNNMLVKVAQGKTVIMSKIVHDRMVWE